MATRIATLSARTKRPRASQHASKRATHASHLSHHQRKCVICHHPDRETIEEMFVHWHSSSSIHRRFMLRDRSTIYDHAHATGLFAKRRRNLRYALEHMIERADECHISSHGIVAAIKAYASLTTSGKWVEPARRVIYTSVSSPAPQRESANHSPRPLANKSAAYVYPQPQSRPSDYPSNYDPSDGWWAYSDAQARNAAALASSSFPSNGKPANHEPQTQNANPAPPANTSAPVAARAPQTTTTHSSSTPAHPTTTTTPCALQQTPPKTAARSANPNRHNSGLKIPPTHTKQTPAAHSNRYK